MKERNITKPNNRIKLPKKIAVDTELKTKNKFKLRTPWMGMEAYRKQCERSHRVIEASS